MKSRASRCVAMLCDVVQAVLGRLKSGPLLPQWRPTLALFLARIWDTKRCREYALLSSAKLADHVMAWVLSTLQAQRCMHHGTLEL